MAGVEFDDTKFSGLSIMIPAMSGRFLNVVGAKAKALLKANFYAGQEINLDKDKDSLGRRIITYNVNKKRTFVKLWSYPANLFEKGRKLRSGRTEPGKGIIQVKLKAAVASRIASYADEFERDQLTKEINKRGLS